MSDDQKEHRILGEMIHRLEPFYSHGPHSIVHTIRDILTFNSHHHHAVVDTSKYEHKPLENYTESQIIKRTVAALQKIYAFNHHYFPESEARFLRPVEPGLTARLVQLTWYISLGSMLSFTLYRGNITTKGLTLFGGIFVGGYLGTYVPNYINELSVSGKRRQLAQRYIDLYGAQHFHEILNPKYPIENIRHLHNDHNTDY
mmetsp:Transcript_26140/g.22988  ORF Transcript_26140/g.22988 Transcript_26140/m.22988 type:complete len:201 (+) Transcript_26140:88-690(+)